MATYEELRRRHIADAATMMPEMLARIEWSADRLASTAGPSCAGW